VILAELTLVEHLIVAGLTGLGMAAACWLGWIAGYQTRCDEEDKKKKECGE